MHAYDAAAVEANLDPTRLIEALRSAFHTGANVPLRHHHTISGTSEDQDATLLLMPAWGASSPPEYIGIKSVTVHPDNPAQGLPSVQGVYLLLDGATGTPVAMIDGPALTARRTAAASALAATYLARKTATHLTIIGTGRLSSELIRARVFVDTREGATREAGDIVEPLTSGILKPDDIAADLFDLCCDKHPGRESETEITLFKSVGTALEDLAAAQLLMTETTP